MDVSTTEYPIKYSLQWFLMKPSYGVFGNFFPTGTYAGIGTTCIEFENVMKSATKKKISFFLVKQKLKRKEWKIYLIVPT